MAFGKKFNSNPNTTLKRKDTKCNSYFVAIIWGLAEVEMSGKKPVWFWELIKILREDGMADRTKHNSHGKFGKEVGRIHREAKVNVIGIKNRWVKIQINRQNISDKFKNIQEYITYNFHKGFNY